MMRRWGLRLRRMLWRPRSWWRMTGVRWRRTGGCSLHTQNPRCCRTGNTGYTSRTSLMVTWRVVLMLERSWYNVFSV